jgi:hypothetical protein
MEDIVMKNRLFIINGYPRCGKGTFIKLCSKYTSCKEISSVDPAKLALMILGWNGAEETKTPEIRKALSNMKDMSTELFDGPVTYVMDKAASLLKDEEYNLIFANSREPAELQRYQDYGATIMLIKRETKEARPTHADQNVENFNYDIIIDNTKDLEFLEKQAYAFLQLLKEGRL